MRLFLKSIFLFSVFCSALQVEPVMAASIFDTVKIFFGGEKNQHAIFEAVQADNVEQVRRILSNDPTVVYNRTQYERTPLHNAETAEIAQALLEHGAGCTCKR